MVKRFKDLYYESDAYLSVMEEIWALRDRLELEIESSSNLTDLMNHFWLWAEKAEAVERAAFERGETNLDGDEEYQPGRNLSWIIRDLTGIEKLDGHTEEKALLKTYKDYYKEHYSK